MAQNVMTETNIRRLFGLRGLETTVLYYDPDPSVDKEGISVHWLGELRRFMLPPFYHMLSIRDLDDTFIDDCAWSLAIE